MASVGEKIKVVVTGYYPSDDEMEGGFNDCVGNPLKTFSDYKRGSKNNSHVSLSVDPKVIKLGSLVNIEGLKDEEEVPVLFYACDVGGRIKGNHVDVCCGDDDEAKDIDSNGETRTLTVIGFQKLK